MVNVSFFTPVRHDEGQQKNLKQYVQEGIEDYFYLGGKSAYVIPGKVVDGSQEVEIKLKDQNKIKQVVLGAIKIISYMTVVIPLIMLIAKGAFRGTHKFHISSQNQTDTQTLSYNSSSTLASSRSSESVIHENTKESTLLQRIQNNFVDIVNKNNIQGVTYYNSQDNHVVFSLEENPTTIFKMRRNAERSFPEDRSMDEHLANIEKAREVCETHRLGMLVIPKVERFELHDSQNRTRVLLSVEKLDLATQSEAHDKIPLEQKAELINQLSKFIFHTGFSDVESRNIPILNPENASTREVRIGLIDLEEMSSSYTGLFGGFKRTGLATLFNARQQVGEAIKDLVSSPESEPIYNEVAALKFEEYPNSKQRLGEIAKGICGQIIMTRRLDSMSNQEPHDFFVEVNHGEFYGACMLHWDNPLSPNAYATDEEYYEAQMIGIVLKKLKKLKIVSKVTRRNGHGVWLKINPKLDHAIGINS